MTNSVSPTSVVSQDIGRALNLHEVRGFSVWALSPARPTIYFSQLEGLKAVQIRSVSAAKMPFCQHCVSSHVT